MDIDIVYDKNIIFYNDTADCIVSAWLLKKYIKKYTGTTPITYKMNYKDKYRLEDIRINTTVWIIGLDIGEENKQFLNRFALKVKWFYNTENESKLVNYDIYNNIDYYSNFIHNKYYGVKNKFIDDFIKHYNYYEFIINNINQIEELYEMKNIEKYRKEKTMFEKIKKRIILNIIDNSFKKEYDDYTYYLIVNNCCEEDVVSYILSINDSVIVTYNIENIKTIKYKVYSNVYNLNNLSKNIGGSVYDNVVIGKTDTINTLFLDIPNML